MSQHTPKDLQIDKFLKSVIELGLYTSKKNLRNHLNYFFGNNDLKNKKILDVGGGVGLLSLWAAAKGGSAICLEPEFQGSSLGMQDNFKRLVKVLSTPSENAQQVSATFQEYSTHDTFDIIALANSINHLNEEATINLRTNAASYSEFLSYFKKMYGLLNDGGRLIITDCDRHNIFDKIGMKSPFMSSIEWQKHQHPAFWKKMIEEAGFEDVEISWSSPNSLGKLGQALLGNRLVAFFLLSHFRIEAKKY